MKLSQQELSVRSYPGVCVLLTLGLITPILHGAPNKNSGQDPTNSQNSAKSSPNSGQGPSASVVNAAQKEIERLQNLLTAAQTEIQKARNSMKAKDYESSLIAYRKALEKLPESPNTADIRKEASEGFRDSAIELAKVRIAEGRYQQSEQILDELLTRDPQCRAALRIKSQLSTQGFYNKTITPLFRADIEQVKQWILEGQGFYDTGRYDLAIKRADQVLSKDPYNVAARKLQEIANNAKSDYGREAYNEARSRALARVDQTWASPIRRFGAAASSGPVTTKIESSQLEKLRRKLNDIIIPEIRFTDKPLNVVAEALSEQSKEADKSTDGTKGVVILVQLPGVSSGSATPKSGKGSTSLIDLAPPSDAAGGGPMPTVTTPLLERFKLIDILNAVTAQSGTKWTITDSLVTIVSANTNTERLVPKSWPVSPSFFNSPGRVDAELSSGGLGGILGKGAGASGSASGATPRTGRSRIDAKEVLMSQGVKFEAPGSTATYNPRAQTLTVLNTQDQLEVVDSLVRDADQLSPAQVEIQAKFVEFSQSNLKELSFDWLLGQSNLPGSGRIFTGGGNTGSGQINNSSYPFIIPDNSGRANAGRPVGVNPLTSGNRSGSLALSSNAIDSLLAGVTGSAGVAPAAFSLAGAFTDPQFQLVVRALNQAKGVDLLSSPSITVRSGSEALIEIIREFKYPTEFTPPQIPQQVGAAGGGAAGANAAAAPQSIPVTPTTPSAFEMKPTGVRLPVTPTIQGDGFTVDLDMKPEVTEFEGFINYGSPINQVASSSALSSGAVSVATTPTKVVLTENVINQPIFSVRRIQTNVSIEDGQTIALGGLIREDVQKVNDKVPVLGDIPLVGRLFRSNVDQHIKKNLTIFVSVRLIDAAGQPVNSKDALEDPSTSSPVPNLTEASLPLLGR